MQRKKHLDPKGNCPNSNKTTMRKERMEHLTKLIGGNAMKAERKALRKQREGP